MRGYGHAQRVGERHFDGRSLGRGGELHLEVDDAVPETRVEARSVAHVGNVLPLTRVEETVAPYARKTEEVLILEIRSVAQAEDLKRDEVLSPGLHIARDVELGLKLAVLAVSHILPVDPQVDVGGDRTETRHDLSSVPPGGYLYRAAVRPHGVILDRHVGRIVAELASPPVSHIDILPVAVAVGLPQPRHGHRVPVAVVVAHAEKVGGFFVGVAHPRETPVAVERQETFGGRPVTPCGKGSVLVGKKIGVHRHAVHRVHGGVVPLVARLGPRGGGAGECGHCQDQMSHCFRMNFSVSLV